MEDISVEEVYLCKTRRDFPVDMLPSCEDKTSAELEGGLLMNYATIEEIAAKWGITTRQVRSYCANNRIPGATLEQGEWRIPANATKPERKRRRTFPTTILGVLEAERSSRISGGLYHRLQVRHHALRDCGELQAILLSGASGLAARQPRSPQ